MAAKGDGGKSTYQDKKYKLRPGTNAMGREYEFKITTLFALRCILENVDDLWLASNAEDAGNFDDVILHLQKPSGKSVTYMFQLKHQEHPKTISEKELLAAKSDFSLPKYSGDIADLKSRMSCGKKSFVHDLGEFENIYFVIFTNRDVSRHKFLESECSDDLTVWNTHGTNGNVCRFKLDQLPQGFSPFCANIHLFANQVHVKFLNERIEAEVAKLATSFLLSQVDTKTVAEKFTKYVTDWAKGELGGNYYLTKQDVLSKLGELFFRQYMIDLSREQFGSYRYGGKAIWSKIMSHKVVTIVEADEAVDNFLKSYISSEVRQYHSEERWGCKLSREAQKALYEKHKNLKNRMHKIVGDCGEINLLHVYKYLWLSNKVPLLLQIFNREDYNNILQIIKKFNLNLRVVIVNKASLALPPLEVPPTDKFLTLCDLNDEERAKILQQQVKLQGRSSIALGGLIDETMHALIKCQDVIHILLGDCNIGNRYAPMSEDFIPRSLLPVFLNFTVFHETKNKLFIVTTHSETEELESKLKDRSFYKNLKPCLLIIKESELGEKLTDIEKHKVGKKAVLYLHFDGNNWLEWRGSQGSVAGIRQHQHVGEDDPSLGLKPDYFAKNILNNTHVLVGGPGMGKSTLVDFLAIEAPPTLWVIKVALNRHAEYYQNVNVADLTASNHLQYFQNKCDGSELAKAVFRKLLDARKVLVLLDGLDEVVTCNQNAVIAMAKRVHDERYTMWITARPHMKVELENEFSTLATTLKPFSKDDQSNFLVKYFTKIADSLECKETLIEVFVKGLLLSAKTNLHDWGQQFTEMPLHCKLLADVFSDEFKTSLEKGVVNRNHSFDLLYLYEEFLRRKTEILCNTYGHYAQEMRVFFEKYQKLFALTVVFDKHLLLKLFIDAQLEEYYRSEQQILPFLQREGIVVLEQNDDEARQKFSINFVHRTFAEYLSAQWLCENFDSRDDETRKTIKTIIREKRSASDYTFLFKVFDCMLASDCLLFKTIINGQSNEAQRIMDDDPSSVDLFDKGGRTVLHIAALYGMRHRIGYQNSTANKDTMVDVLSKIPKSKIESFINVKDKILGYSAIDYAITVTKSLAVANKLCKQVRHINLKLDSPRRINFKVNVAYCCSSNYGSLLPMLFRNFIYEQLIWKYADKDTKVVSSCQKFVSKKNMPRIKKFLHQWGATTMAEVFRLKRKNSDYYDNLFCASAFGTTDNLLYLLAEGAQVSEKDIYGNTPLHCAVIHERCDCVKFLLAEGAQRSCANINETNQRGDTPLLLAVKFKSVEAMELLLSEGADVNIRNKSGNSAMDCAVASGDCDMLAKLVAKADVNAKNELGQTPLHIALDQKRFQSQDVQNQIRAVNFLINNSANVNIRDNHGNTALHYTIKVTSDRRAMDFYHCAALLLLNEGADATIKNQANKTALDLATDNKRDEITSLIKQKLENPTELVKSNNEYVNTLLQVQL